MPELVADIAVVLATATTLTFLLPQVIVLVRTRDAAGVSTTWPAFGLVVNLGWVVYLAHEGLWISVLAPFGTAIGYGATLIVLRRIDRPLGDSALRGAVLASILVAVTTSAGWPALGIALGFSHAVTLAPSVWTAYRTARPSGIARGTWQLGLAEAVLWGLYGWHHADAGILTFSLVAMVGSGLMLARWRATRDPAPVV